MQHLDHHHENEKKLQRLQNIQHHIFSNLNEKVSTCLVFESEPID